MTVTLNHGARLNAENWDSYLRDDGLPDATRRHIENVIAVATTDFETKLRRRHVFEAFQRSVGLGVVTSVMWGYPKGRRPGGATFQAVFGQNPAIADCVAEMKLRTLEAREVCTTLGQFTGLGPSTYTKIAYFAGIQTNDGPCLIYDQMVMRSIAGSEIAEWDEVKQRLGTLMLPDGRFRVFSRPVQIATYGHYIRSANYIAAIEEISTDLIEMNLFLSAPRGRQTPFRCSN